jgi:hypothetical protein
MFKKKKKGQQEQVGVNPELLQVEKEFKREVAVIETIPRLKKIGLLLWLILDVALVTIFLFGIGSYLVNGVFVDRAQISNIISNVDSIRSISVERSADALFINNAQLFALGEDRYDFYAEVDNPNADWYATFTYYFTSSSGDTRISEGFILPDSTQRFAALNNSFDTRPSGSELVIEAIEWRRVDGHEVPDVNEFLEEHQQFLISDAVYEREVELEEGSIPRTTFTILNNTPYSYWTPEFFVLIMRSGKVAGVNTVTLSGLGASESRDVVVNWFGAVPSSGTVEVIPNINYFDPDVYMPLGGDVQEDIRDEINDRRR